MTTLDWLLDSDPAIRWQVMRDLTDAPADEVARRARQGRHARAGARSCSRLQRPDGHWGGGRVLPRVDLTTPTLHCSGSFGLDPPSPRAQRAVELGPRERPVGVRRDCRFFDGEVEPCINGRAVAIGAYFGQDVRGIVDRLLTEQMADGGWNCEQERRLDARFVRHHDQRARGAARARALDRRERRRRGGPSARARSTCSSAACSDKLSTGEIGQKRWLYLGFPNPLALRRRPRPRLLPRRRPAPDERMAEALELVESKRDADGRWPLDHAYHERAARRPRRARGRAEPMDHPARLRMLRWAGEAPCGQRRPATRVA